MDTPKCEWLDILNSVRNTDIIIKVLDKGGTDVIVNTKHYLKMINDSNCDKKVIRSIAKILKKYRDCLTNQELKLNLTNVKFPIRFFA